jgi:hypothetical protein
MHDLKIDKKLPHHYLIMVDMYPMNHSKQGIVYLRGPPFHFTNKDVINLQGALILSEDKLFKTSIDEALTNFNSRDIVSTIRGLQLTASANDCTLHHFSTEHKFNKAEDWFKSLVHLANKSSHSKDLLKNSRVR